MRYKKRKKAASQVMAMAVLVIAVLAVLFVMASSEDFKIRNILVVGNRALSKEEIVLSSGVELGENLLSLSDARLKKSLENNRYIEYVGYEFDYRGTLTLKINERTGVGVVGLLGIYYVVDASGMVLEQRGSTYPDDIEGPKINGLSFSDGAPITVGLLLPVRDTKQLDIMKKVLTAMSKTEMLSRASSLDLKSSSNIYIMTTDKAKIVLGDENKLETKLLIAREVLHVREPLGTVQGAEIDVSSGKEAHYIPETLPTITPTPTATPTYAPATTPKN